jgi:CheY-like chemotaxis protein
MAATQRPLRVLIADDEKIIADTLAIIIRNSGFSVTTVYGGNSAVETAEKLQPEVVICDIRMPDMNGVDAANRISQILPTSKIVLCSGHTEAQGSLENAHAAGLKFVFLAKPVSPAVFLDFLKSYEEHLSIATELQIA